MQRRFQRQSAGPQNYGVLTDGGGGYSRPRGRQSILGVSAYDAVETAEFPRNYGKASFNIALNAKSYASARAAIARDLNLDMASANSDADRQRHRT